MKKNKTKKHGFPLPEDQMYSLFIALDEVLDSEECDRTLRVVRDHLKQLKNSKKEAQVIAWLKKHGAYCDCEALQNVARRIWRDN